MRTLALLAPLSLLALTSCVATGDDIEAASDLQDPASSAEQALVRPTVRLASLGYAVDNRNHPRPATFDLDMSKGVRLTQAEHRCSWAVRPLIYAFSDGVVYAVPGGRDYNVFDLQVVRSKGCFLPGDATSPLPSSMTLAQLGYAVDNANHRRPASFDQDMARGQRMTQGDHGCAWAVRPLIYAFPDGVVYANPGGQDYNVFDLNVVRSHGCKLPTSTSSSPNGTMEVLIDTSSEVSAKAVVRGASPGQTMRFQWVVYDGNQEYFQVPGSRRELDLFALGPYSGKALGLKVTVGNKTYLSKNRVDLMGVDKNDFRRETLEAKKPGLGLLGTPIVRRLHFSYETYRIGCKKRTVISTNTIGSGFQEETCDYRNRPKEFTVEQLAVLRAAAISVYKTLRLEQVNATTKALERPVETCVKSLANMSHGEFNLVPDVTLPYTLDNVFGVYNKQVSRWSGITNVQDFRIHIMVNDNNSANPLVLGHASLGAVRADFDHVKLANADGDRFEVHVNNRYLPATTTSAPTNVPLTVDGKNYSIEISMKALAETIAHEMMHQMGISHTQNSGGADFQDDFVYSLGQCVNRNHVAQYDWNDVVAF